jgi:hypothetical protein
MDNKQVRAGATFPYHLGYCERTKKKDGFAKIRREQPALIGAYNGIMGAVDLRDQKGSYFNNTIRCKRPMRGYFINNLLQSIVCNTQVLENLFRAKKLQQLTSQGIV